MTMSSHPRRRGEASIFKKTPPKLGHLWRPLLVHIPDLGQQGRQLLVLKPQCKDLLRVHGAERAQAHQFHEHSWEAELVLPGEEASRSCWGPCPAKPALSGKPAT